MNTKVIISVLAVVSLGLLVAVIASRKTISDQKDSISYHSNQWQETRIKLDDLTQVHNTTIADLDKRNASLLSLTNSYNEALTTLAKTEKELQQSESTLKVARDELASRDARIVALEAQNKDLDAKSVELNATLAALTTQIDATQRKLAASEGDKALLQKELSRLLTEKAELERQMNDLAFLKAQVSRLKAERSIALRLDWMRRGLYGSGDRNGAAGLMGAGPVKPAEPPANANLNVEINSDGSVKVLPPITNAPASK
jgi:chromosome segregation ATPase